MRHPSQYYYRSNLELSPDWLMQFADEYWERSGVPFREDWLTFVIDECQLLFNSRSWTAKDRLAWLEFFSQHRKYGYKVLFIAQADKMIDNQFRMLIEYEYKHRKVSKAGFAGWLMALPFRGRLFVQVLYYYQMKERLSSEWYVARKRDMQLYDSLARFERTENTVVAAADPSA